MQNIEMLGYIPMNQIAQELKHKVGTLVQIAEKEKWDVVRSPLYRQFFIADRHVDALRKKMTVTSDCIAVVDVADHLHVKADTVRRRAKYSNLEVIVGYNGKQYIHKSDIPVIQFYKSSKYNLLEPLQLFMAEVKEVLFEKNLTQGKLADICEMDEVYLSGLLTGRVPVSVEKLNQIAEGMGQKLVICLVEGD